MLKKLMPLMPELAVVIFAFVGVLGTLFQLGGQDPTATIALLVFCGLGAGAVYWLKKRRAV